MRLLRAPVVRSPCVAPVITRPSVQRVGPIWPSKGCSGAVVRAPMMYGFPADTRLAGMAPGAPAESENVGLWTTAFFVMVHLAESSAPAPLYSSVKKKRVPAEKKLVMVARREENWLM